MKLFGMRNLQSLHFLLGRLGFLVLITFSLSCNREPDTHKSFGTVKVRIPFNTESGAYDLQEVTLLGVHSLYKFTGDYVRFYVYPSVSERKLLGYQPKTRFLKSGDVYVPEDVLSQQLAVIYAHFQRFAVLDAEMGAGGLLSWPRDVGVLVRYRMGDEFAMNNAFYETKTDAMLVVPYTQDHLPIPVNGGILAHEHFHAIYHRLAGKALEPEKKTSTPPKKKISEEELDMDEVIQMSKALPNDNVQFIENYHVYLSRAINEGLADFWAWIYTGDVDFLQYSLPQEKRHRSLKISEREAQNFIFPDSKIWKMEIENWERIPNERKNDRFAYHLGTNYARMLRYYSSIVQSSRGISSQEARKLVGAAIIRTLPSLKDEILKVMKKGEYFEPYHFFSLLEASTPDLKNDEKEFIQNLVSRAKKQDLPQIVAAP